jgi:hypothetical protein
MLASLLASFRILVSQISADVSHIPRAVSHDQLRPDLQRRINAKPSCALGRNPHQLLISMPSKCACFAYFAPINDLPSNASHSNRGHCHCAAILRIFRNSVSFFQFSQYVIASVFGFARDRQMGRCCLLRLSGTVSLTGMGASIRVALRDVQCPRCNGYGRPRIIALARQSSI